MKPHQLLNMRIKVNKNKKTESKRYASKPFFFNFANIASVLLASLQMVTLNFR